MPITKNEVAASELLQLLRVRLLHKSDKESLFIIFGHPHNKTNTIEKYLKELGYEINVAYEQIDEKCKINGIVRTFARGVVAINFVSKEHYSDFAEWMQKEEISVLSI